MPAICRPRRGHRDNPGLAQNTIAVVSLWCYLVKGGAESVLGPTLMELLFPPRIITFNEHSR